MELHSLETDRIPNTVEAEARGFGVARAMSSERHTENARAASRQWLGPFLFSASVLVLEPFLLFGLLSVYEDDWYYGNFALEMLLAFAAYFLLLAPIFVSCIWCVRLFLLPLSDKAQWMLLGTLVGVFLVHRCLSYWLLTELDIDFMAWAMPAIVLFAAIPAILTRAVRGRIRMKEAPTDQAIDVVSQPGSLANTRSEMPDERSNGISMQQVFLVTTLAALCMASES